MTKIDIFEEIYLNNQFIFQKRNKYDFVTCDQVALLYSNLNVNVEKYEKNQNYWTVQILFKL